MFGSNSSNLMDARRAGAVKTASEGAPVSAEPQKLLGVVRAEVVFVQYTNQRGEQETGMFFDVNGQLVSTPDTSEWCKKLRPISGWLEKQVRDAIAPRPTAADLPESDSVDVMSNDG